MPFWAACRTTWRADLHPPRWLHPWPAPGEVLPVECHRQPAGHDDRLESPDLRRRAGALSRLEDRAAHGGGLLAVLFPRTRMASRFGRRRRHCPPPRTTSDRHFCRRAGLRARKCRPPGSPDRGYSRGPGTDYPFDMGEEQPLERAGGSCRSICSSDRALIKLRECAAPAGPGQMSEGRVSRSLSLTAEGAMYSPPSSTACWTSRAPPTRPAPTSSTSPSTC